MIDFGKNTQSDYKKPFGSKLGKLAGELGKKTSDLAAAAGSAAIDAAGKAGQKTSELASSAGTMAIDAAGKASQKTVELADMAKTGALSSKDAMMSKMDVTGDGKVDIEDIIVLGMRAPGIKINRDEFLRKELFKNYPEDIIEIAVAQTPARAGISVEEIDKIADEVIQYERVCVSGISAALGAPGGAAMIATIPADITQYYGYMLRATQKLLYLYGFPEINTEDNDQSLDSETLNILIICLGAMYGAAGADNAIKGIAKALSVGVERQLMRKALTKGTIYPIVKSVSKWFGVKMTKDVFAGFFKKAIPLLGSVIGGSVTYVTFKPCCVKLKESLRDTRLSDPDNISSENDIIDTIAEDIVSDKDLEAEVLQDVLQKDDFDFEELVKEDD